MERRRLGKTDLSISTLSLGTVALGMAYGITPGEREAAVGEAGMPPPTKVEAIRLIHRALDQGINFIDTARAYGRSEEILGHALEGRREEVVLATKVGCFDADGRPLRGEALRREMEASIEKSLRLLRTDHVDLLMLHSAPLELLQAGEAVDHLRTFQRRGLARYTGASTYGQAAPQLAIELGLDALQVAFNILDQRLAVGLFPVAQAQGTGLIVRSVFLKGALTSRAADLPAHLAPLKAQSAAVEQFGRSLTPPLDLAELALRFVLSQPAVTTSLVGVRTEKELAAAVAAAAKPPLSPEVMAHLASLRSDEPELLDPSSWGAI